MMMRSNSTSEQKMSPIYTKYFAKLEALGITLQYYPNPPRIVFDGCNESVRKSARNYLCKHPELIAEIALRSGYVWKNDRGGIITSHEQEVWAAIIAPLTPFEELVRDFWLERQAVRKGENLPDDFYSTWLDCTVPDGLGHAPDRESYWGMV